MAQGRSRPGAAVVLFLVGLAGLLVFFPLSHAAASPASDSFARGARVMAFHSPAKAHVVNREILRLAALRGYGPIPPASSVALTTTSRKGALIALVALFFFMSGLTFWLWRGLGRSLASPPSGHGPGAFR